MKFLEILLKNPGQLIVLILGKYYVLKFSLKKNLMIGKGLSIVGKPLIDIKRDCQLIIGKNANSYRSLFG